MRKDEAFKGFSDQMAVDQYYEDSSAKQKQETGNSSTWNLEKWSFRVKPSGDDEEDDQPSVSSTIFCDSPNCEESFDNIVDYEEHYAKKHTHQCSICKKSYETRFALDLHFEEMHSVMFQLSLERNGNFPKYRCLDEACQRRFLSAIERNRHSFDEHGLETGEAMDVKRKMRRRVEHQTTKAIEELTLAPDRTIPKKIDFHFTDE